MAAAAAIPPGRALAGQTDYTGFGSGVWSMPTNWDAGTPIAGSVANLFNGRTVNYNISQAASPGDLTAVQIAGNGILQLPTIYGSTYLQAQTMYIGGTVTGSFGTTAANGSGTVLQYSGTVYLDPGGPVATSLLVDPTSSYSINGGGSLFANSEQIAGTFAQAAGLNQLSSGSSLNILATGTYNLSGSAVLTVDTIANAGTFSQNTGSIQGNSPLGTTFLNTGVFNVSGGTFNGVLNNSQGANTTILGVPIPFTTIANNGRLTINGSSGTFSGTITGTGNVNFAGPNTVQMTSSNPLTGTVNVVGGTLGLDDSAAPVFTGPVVISSGGTVQLQTSSQLASNQLLTINGGMLLLNGYNQTVGSLSITGGSVQQSSGAGLTIGTGLVLGGKGTDSITGGLQTPAGYTFNIASGGTVTVGGTISGLTSTAAVPSLYLTGGGTLNVTGSSPLTTIDLNAGSFVLASGGIFGGNNTSLTVETAGVFNLNNQAAFVGDLYGTGRVALGSGTFTINSAIGSTFSGEIDGTGTVTKNGAGTLVLGGQNQWTGPLLINTGTIVLPTGATLASTAVTVAPNATLTVNGSLSAATALTDNGTTTFAAGTNGSAANPIHVIQNVGSITLGSSFANNSIVNGLMQVLPSTIGNRTLLYTSALNFAGAPGAWKGQLDLSDNDMIVHNGSLATITNEAQAGLNLNGGANFLGQGITSSAAASDTTHLTAVGVVLNNQSGTTLFGGAGQPLFDGYAPTANDVLLKYTYFGDTNLDGVVDGSDYTNIDSAFAAGNMTGWFNGDFNYDGVIDGSDYSLIDNADNNQEASITALLAASTAELAAPTSAVPEPATSLIPFAAFAGLALSRLRIAFRRRS